MRGKLRRTSCCSDLQVDGSATSSAQSLVVCGECLDPPTGRGAFSDVGSRSGSSLGPCVYLEILFFTSVEEAQGPAEKREASLWGLMLELWFSSDIKHHTIKKSVFDFIL